MASRAPASTEFEPAPFEPFAEPAPAPEPIAPLSGDVAAFPGSVFEATGGPDTGGSASFGESSSISPLGAQTGSSAGAVSALPEAATAPGEPAEPAAAPATETGTSSASSSSATMTILRQPQATRLADAWRGAGTASSDEVSLARADLIENPPSLDAPSGISPASEAGRAPVPTTRAARVAAAPGIAEIDGEGVCRAEPDLSHEPATAPVETAPSGPAVLSGAPEDPAARSAYFLQQIGFAPVADDHVDTSAGPRPTVDLSEEADPGRIAELAASQSLTIGAEFNTAGADMCVDEGVDAIYPTLPEETLLARFDPGATELGGDEDFDFPALPGEFESAIDRGGARGWPASYADIDSRYATGAETRSSREAAAHATADEEIATLCDDAVSDQRDWRMAAGDTVAEAREGWRGELDAAQVVYEGERTRISTSADSEVTAAREGAERDAAAALAEGEREAEAERARTEVAAADARADAERQAEEADGLLDWVVSKVSDFFDALRSLLHDLFDALRWAVRKIIAGVKAIANGIIEAARTVIVGIIRGFGALLELAADVLLAAFPEARDRAKALIRQGVEAAEEGVNRAAQALRDGVNWALDRLGDALIAILDAYEAIYAAILNIVRFLVVGLVEVYRYLARLAIAAYNSPSYFEGQIYEELLGSDLTQPLPFELTEAEAAQLASGGGASGPAALGGGGGGGGDFGAFEHVMTAAHLADGDIEMDEVLPLDADPAFFSSLALGDGGTIEFGESNDPEATVAALRAEFLDGGTGGGAGGGMAGLGDSAAAAVAPMAGGAADRPRSTEEQLQALMDADPECACDPQPPTAETGPPIPLESKIGPLSKGQRARYMMSQMWKGIRQWFACNWQTILAVVIAALLVIIVIIVATVLSGGTIGGLLAGAAALAAPLLELLVGAMIIYAVGRALAYLADYLKFAWQNRMVDSSKSLARAAAIPAVELIFAVLTYVTAGAFRILSTAVKGVAKGVRVVAGAGGRVLRGIGSGLVRIAGRTGRVMLVNGKLVLRNLRRGFARNVRTLRELGERLLGRLRFRRFRIRREGRWFILEGYLNPWVRIGQSPTPVEVDDAAITTNVSRPGNLARRGDDVIFTNASGNSVSGTVISRSSHGPYRRNFAHFMGTIKGDVIHHAIEQQLGKLWNDIISPSEMHSMFNLRRITGGIFNNRVHLSRVRTLWDDFYRVAETVPINSGTAAMRRNAVNVYRRYVDDMIRNMNNVQRTSPAYRAAMAAGNEVEAARILDAAMDMWQASRPPSSVLSGLFVP